MELSLKDRIARWVKSKNDWVSGGAIERVVAEKTEYKPSNASRRCRELVEEGTFLVKQERGTVWYKFNGEVDEIISSIPRSIEIFDRL